MEGITITWREGPFRCEHCREAGGGWLYLLSGDEVIAKEPVGSVAAAYTRARELSESLAEKHAKRA